MSRFSLPDSGADHLGLVCLLLDAGGRVGWSNDAAAAVASSTQTQVRALADLVHADDRALIGDLLATVSAQGRAVGIVRIQDTPNGSRQHFHLVLTCTAEGLAPSDPARMLPPSREDTSFTAGTGGTILAQAWDVTCLVRQQQELEVYAFRDNLTGLANRRTFMTLLDQTLNTPHPFSPPVAVIFADIDDFKTINDTYGHHGGDYVLIELATRLSSRLRPEDTLARIGGDEFAVICPNLTGWSAAAAILERLRSASAAPITISGDTIGVKLSVGLAFAEETNDHHASAANLLALAGGRMYAAKLTAKTQTEPTPPTQEKNSVYEGLIPDAIARALLHPDKYNRYPPAGGH